MTTGTHRRLDLEYLRTASEPVWEDNRPLTLVYEPSDGTQMRRYEVDLQAAWSYEGSPYELLSGRFETYNGIGCCWFEEAR